MKLRIAPIASLAALALFVAACGDAADPIDDPFTSAADRTVVVGNGSRAVFATPDGAACIDLPSGCVKPQEKCGEGARADVIVDASGKVLEIVCYPPAADGTAPTNADGDVDLAKQNKGVVVLDGDDDGVDIAGNVSANGNNVTVYGQGPGLSVIGGSVNAGGNNFSLRGVTVQKDVSVAGNNATLVLCEVHGDVVIEGNNAVMAECTVFGKVTVKGNNAILVGNRIAGGIVMEGKETLCEGNVAFSDANGDRTVADGELGAALSCLGGKK